MSNDTNNPTGNGPGAESPAAQAARAAQGANVEAAEAAQPTGEAPAADAQVGALAAELAEVKSQLDRAIRAVAELDNMRKRAEREKDEVAKYAITKFARDMLTIGDNLQRAIAAVPPDAIAANAALGSFHEGVLMTERELVKAFERNGIARVEPRGEPFNPHRHQVVLEMEGAGVAPGTVVEVFQPGYVLEERVLRPAMVGVAKGAARPQPQQAANGAPPAAANDDRPRGPGAA